MKTLNNISRRELKLRIKKLVESKSNNIVIKIDITDSHHAECHCQNKFSCDNEMHTIEVLMNDKMMFLIYEDCLFSQIVL